MIAEWYVQRRGQPVGPLTEEEVRELLHAQEIRTTCLVWRKGQAEWEPISVYFPEALPKDIVRQLQKIEQPEAQSEPIGLPIPINLILLAVLSFLLFVVVAGIVYDREGRYPALVEQGWFPLFVLAVILSFFTIFWAWRRANVVQNQFGFCRSVGWLRVCSVFAALMVVSNSVFYASRGGFFRQVSQAHAEMRGYSVRFEPNANAILISGPLGLGSAEQFLDLLDRHQGVRRVYVDSPGGLIGEARAIVNAIESQEILQRSLKVSVRVRVFRYS